MEGFVCTWFENCGTAGMMHMHRSISPIGLHLILQLTQIQCTLVNLYVGINDRKSQLHERIRKIKGGMLVCLQVWMAT